MMISTKILVYSMRADKVDLCLVLQIIHTEVHTQQINILDLYALIKGPILTL